MVVWHGRCLALKVTQSSGDSSIKIRFDDDDAPDKKPEAISSMPFNLAIVPQGLKPPGIHSALCGTAKAVPFQDRFI
jgi:hypothetical protein